MSVHDTFNGFDSHKKPSLKLSSGFELPKCFPLTVCQSPRVDQPRLISQFQASPLSKSEFGSPSDEKLCHDVDSLILSDSPKDFSPSVPGLSLSPSDSMFSSEIPHSFPRALPDRRCSIATRSPDCSIFSITHPEVRRAKTVASAFPHLKSISRRNSATTHKPINALSYNSLPSSEAVSLLSSFAESSAMDITRVAPDEEGEEVGDYIMGKVLGHGAFSTVREAFTINHDDGDLIHLAVKVIRKDEKSDVQHLEERISALQDEVAVWKQLKHPNLLRFIELIDTDYAEFVFMELCSHGTLLSLVTESGKLSESQARMFFCQVAEAVRYLHQDAHIIHCDLKLENLVLSSKEILKLSDFGLSQSLHRPSPSNSSPVGSVAYCPPELLANPPRSNSIASDIWSLGVILFSMVAGKLPFSDGYEPRLVMKIRSGRFTIPDEFSPELTELVSSMLHSNPESRPSIADVLDSKWCQDH